jgi:16S rRNA processing protein RimM
MTLPEGYVLLGTLGRTFQLEGGLRFYPLGDAEGAALQKLERVFIENFGERVVARVRPVGAQLVVYFVGESTPERAQALVNAGVYADRAALPDVEAHYLELLLEKPVLLNGETLGEVLEVIPAGSDLGQDVLVVETATGEVLIPLQADYVSVTDEAITLTEPPEGLLELNAQ